MVMSQDQTAGRCHSLNIDNSSFGRVDDFKYLVTNRTYKNSILEEIEQFEFRDRLLSFGVESFVF
jgi:hypothetical protein